MEPQEAQVEWTNREGVGVRPTPQPELLATELRTTERPLRADEQGPRHPSSTPGNPAAFSFTEGLGESRGRGVLPEEGREIFLPQVAALQLGARGLPLAPTSTEPLITLLCGCGLAASVLAVGSGSGHGPGSWGKDLATSALTPSPPPLLPQAYWHYVLAKAENLQPEIKSIASHLNQEGAVSADQLRWSKRVARPTYLKNTGRLVSELYVRDNCHPLKASVLVWIRFPMWIFMSVALWNLSTGATHSDVGFSIQEQLPTSGVLWFPDLTALDSSWILLISVGVISLLIVEIFALQKIGMTPFQMYITCFVRVVSVLMIPIAATVPSSIVLYCLCSRFMGLSQNLLLHSPGFCQLCQIPLTKSDSDTPCKDLFATFYAKFISRE
ncbi:LOW QUALITY PROTEIN: cytochrome c oxidase assembly protein COX18, mitochondrial-like [Leopardus geoffroyi]|uniref:LOW QUALITY PROTEIN: cytochrome c oxidase assembly protein COX18, mitochondrial-like n=1 Tax=Leopardus geoffroyi TaxID=46844 RepID=UPI001E25D44E|nr:LOW QUALITY PROTEIN: cytochrome c oxidase assembly protein COX18, mitochondrial-like [Leopardus geoffroyi]